MMSNKTHRYPGTRPFETDEQNLFFGRSEDSKSLHRLVFNEKNVLLYAKSGLGKSSLINAGLLPLFQHVAGYEIIQVRFGNYNAQVADYEKPLDKIIAQIKAGINPGAAYLDKIIAGENSLWYRLKKLQRLDDPRIFLFIFDQFEELLTYPQEDIFQFKTQFANLLFANIPANIRAVLDTKLDNDENLFNEDELKLLTMPLSTKALFSIRSDRMSDLNRISDYFPNILKTFYELKPLTRPQAKEAIVKPAQQALEKFISPPFSFTQQVIEKIIKALEDKETDTIESFQLQMVCRYAEDLVVQKKTIAGGEVSEEDLGDIQSIFAENYRRVLSEVPREYLHQVQVLMEERLIVSGNRVPLPEIMILQQEQIPQDLLNKLLDSHILRAERNTTGGRSIELSHDSLIPPIAAAFKKRSATEKEQAEKLRAEAEALKRQQELEAARREADKERTRAAAEAGLRKDAEVAKDKAKKNLQVARIVSLIALIVAVVALFLFVQAQSAKREAIKEKQHADSLRIQADESLAKLKQQQAIGKANELKSYAEQYENAGNLQSAKKQLQAAFDALRNYPELSLYKALQSKLNEPRYKP